ncbi:hypothetical protein ILUMI_04491 [Ignelater luminosus]|uniref:Uncharacterized protein n=1 Tax=Ignelater luminosus TaxID=2038154 RepID=A0A8K0GL44_IGNLU|nr:hypothetical protein ILUMI_04491 [Ignelater luminosus]
MTIIRITTMILLGTMSDGQSEDTHYVRFYHIMVPIFIVVILLKMGFFIFRGRTRSIVLVRSYQISRSNNPTTASSPSPQNDEPPSYEEATIDVPQNIRLTQNSNK